MFLNNFNHKIKMKKYIVVFFLTISIMVDAQTSYLEEDGKTHLWGQITPDDLQSSEYREWYQKSQEEFHPEIKSIDYQRLKDTKVKIFMGTWCGDTKNWVPKFLELWHKLGFKESQLELIALHNSLKLYKQAPDHAEKEWDIHRVPTFIFLNKDKEIGRIVESPLNTLEIDLAQIALGIPSLPRYRGVYHLQEYMKKTNIDSLHKDMDSILNKIFRVNTNAYELTTFALKLEMDGYLKQAYFVHSLNVRLFRHNPYVYNKLGDYYKRRGKLGKAKEQFLWALVADSKNEYAQEQIDELEESNKSSQ